MRTQKMLYVVMLLSFFRIICNYE